MDGRQSSAGVPKRAIFICAALCTGIICWSVWPGLMSYDSLHTLYQARVGLIDNIQPAMCTYVQALCDRICSGPGLLFLLQNAVYIFGCAFVVYLMDCPFGLALGWLLLLIFCPPVLGLLLVVWKDVGCMAFLTACFAALLFAELRKSKRALIVAGLFLFSGVAFRLNAIAAAPPLLAYLFYISDNLQQSNSGERKDNPIQVKKIALRIVVVAVTMLTIVSLLNTYRLPDFKRLDGNLLTVMQLFDLIGISHYSGKLVVPQTLYSQQQNFSLQNLGYFPECVEYSFDDSHFWPSFKPLSKNALDDLERKGQWCDQSGKKITDSDVNALWQQTVAHYPQAFLKHRLAATASFFCIDKQKLHYPTHPRIDSNDLGVRLVGSPLMMLLLAWVYMGSRWFVCLPYFFYTCGAGLGAWLLMKKPPGWYRPICLLVSGWLMCIAIVPVTVAADFRYNSWGWASTMLAFALTVLQARQQKNVSSADSSEP